MDIIFHVGFPKCGSSTLQETIFKPLPGYLGTHKQLPLKQNYAKQFQKLAPLGLRVFFNHSMINEWKKIVQSTYQGSVAQVILSSEFLTQKNIASDKPIVKFLKKFQDEVWDIGKVKVILVIRNEAEPMASSYAQISNRMYFPSQEDFEAKVLKNIAKGKCGLDYKGWIEGLKQTVGEENLCILKLEEFGTAGFKEKLSGFLNIPLNSDLDSTLNKRRVAERSWQLRPFDAEYKAKVSFNKIFDSFWPPQQLNEQRELIRKYFIKFLAGKYNLNSKKFKGNMRSTSITLSPELENKINAVCGAC